MENIDINNTEIKPKNIYTEAQIRAVKAYHARHKDTEEYKLKSRANAKRYMKRI